MKKIIALILLVTIISCKNEKKDTSTYVTFSGKINDNTDTTLTVGNRDRSFVKTITLNDDGSFSDTLKVPKQDIYYIETSPGKAGAIYLKNGYDLNLTTDSNNFFKGFNFKGNDTAANTNKLIIEQYLFAEKTGNPANLFKLEKDEFNKGVDKIEADFNHISNLYDNIEPQFAQESKDKQTQLLTNLRNSYDKGHAQSLAQEKLAKGNPSPQFTKLKNYKGGVTSLKDLKGKYIYIDVWATWCRPCLGEIPALKKLEQAYHNKNIEFVSISTDNPRTAKTWEAAEKKWRRMIQDKGLSGIQLFAGEDDSFQRSYMINSIPRFILIDPNGNIANANAPRPSSPAMIQLLNNLDL